MSRRDPGDPGTAGIVRVCSAQVAGSWDNPESSLARAEGFIRHAALSGADIICFPEQFATGWDPESRNHVQDRSGPIVTAMQSFARDSSIAILGSIRESSPRGPRNTAIAIGSDGRILATYAKVHLFSHGKEDEYFSPGSTLGEFTLGSVPCGIAICYDLRFPELFRLYAQRGVQAVFVPAAWPADRLRHWELFIRARAAENQMYVIGINTTGTTPVDTYTGSSMTADPHGAIIRRAGSAEELLFTDLDPALVAEARRTFPVDRDRKDELYRLLRNPRRS